MSGKKNNDVQVAQDAELRQLVTEIKSCVAKFEKSLRTSLNFARQAGEALTKAKGLLPRSKSWQQWVSDNCAIDIRQAQKYMRIAKCWPELGGDSEKLTINQAQALLSHPGQKASTPGDAEPSSDKQGSKPFRVLKADMAAKTLEAKRSIKSNPIPFTDETRAGKFVKAKAKALVEQVRKEAVKLTKVDGFSKMDAVHIAFALVERLALDLSAEMVFEVAEPELASMEAVTSTAAKDGGTAAGAENINGSTAATGKEDELSFEPKNRISAHQGNGASVLVA